MNQILSVEMSNNKKKKSNKKASIKTIVIFFCMILVILGIAMVAIGIFSREEASSSNSGLVTNTDTNVGTAEVKPNIEIIEGVNSLSVTITSDIEIDNIVYKWNDGEETQVNGNGDTTLELNITIPIGTNTFKITAKDINGGEQSIEKEYTGVDQYNPTISLSQEENVLKINCTSEETISYISYIYDDEAEMTQQVDDVTAEISISAEEGEHTLSIVVVNSDGGKYEETKQLYIPTVSVVTDTTDFIIEITDSRGIETVNMTLNGEQLDEITVNSTSYETTLELQDGENKLVLVVTNSDGLSITRRFRYENN